MDKLWHTILVLILVVEIKLTTDRDNLTRISLLELYNTHRFLIFLFQSHFRFRDIVKISLKIVCGNEVKSHSPCLFK